MSSWVCLSSTAIAVLGRSGNWKNRRIRWRPPPPPPPLLVSLSSIPLPFINLNSNSKRGRSRSRNGHSGGNGNRVVCNYQQLLADVAPTTSTLYGLLLLSGGLYAFTKSGSKGSLFGGLTGAALMASVYFLMQAPETRPVGDALGFGSSFLFSSVFGIRLVATRKFTPAGPLLGFSVCALVVFIAAYLQDS